MKCFWGTMCYHVLARILLHKDLWPKCTTSISYSWFLTPVQSQGRQGWKRFSWEQQHITTPYHAETSGHLNITISSFFCTPALPCTPAVPFPIHQINRPSFTRRPHRMKTNKITTVKMNVFHQHPANKCPKNSDLCKFGNLFVLPGPAPSASLIRGTNHTTKDILGYYKWLTSNLISMHAYCIVVLTFITAAKKTCLPTLLSPFHRFLLQG